MEIRPLTSTELDQATLLRLRLEFIADIRGCSVVELGAAFAEDTRRFLADVTAQARIHSWIAEAEGDLVGGVSVIVTDAPPLPEYRGTREGYVVNMYVRPASRGQGLARALLDELVAAAPSLELRSLHLYATDAGRPLYEQRGFAPNDRFLARRVPDPS